MPEKILEKSPFIPTYLRGTHIAIFSRINRMRLRIELEAPNNFGEPS